jgi:murein L,D-transpeptidase YcbB/YkuD
MPVYVLYLTAETDPDAPDGVTTYADIYHRDRR